MSSPPSVDIYFSDFFEVEEDTLKRYGAFDVSLVSDLPLFIDPFLLFNSKHEVYQQLHNDIIRYLRFLKDKSKRGQINDGLLRSWYTFKEIRQNWLGFSKTGNRGSGLGMDFARALNLNLNSIFRSFGENEITRASHLEKLCLIRSGVGRDHISDFTTNLIKKFLLEYTQTFALENIPQGLQHLVPVEKVSFNYETETWESASYVLPVRNGDYVILTPRDILTRDEMWINRPELVHRVDEFVESLPNAALRAEINNYLFRKLSEARSDQEQTAAKEETLRQYPALIEYYIKDKEDNADEATKISTTRVRESQQEFIDHVRPVTAILHQVGFYSKDGTTYDEAHERVAYLEDCIENKGCHHIFWIDGEPIRKEDDLHILFRLIWYGSPSDVSREVNDGRGPVDFKVSRGARDKTLVEFKLARNTQLRRNLERQVDVYQKASDAKKAIKVVVYFSADELLKVQDILNQLGLIDSRDVVLIDARADNKPSGSKA